MKWRLLFLAAAFRHRNLIGPFLSDQGSLGRTVAQRPEVLGTLLWPYVCLSWGAETRLTRIKEHWAAVEMSAPLLDFAPTEELMLVDLTGQLQGLRVVLDQPKWFMREGQAVLNLFLGDTRVFSLAFSLRQEDVLAAYVGAIQGRNLDGVMQVYKELTDATHGLRPRDFLIELFRMLCSLLGVERIYAVSNAKRHHRSPYFGKNFREEGTVDYDLVWVERGGVPHDGDFYCMPIVSPRRQPDEIPSKKRAMYRRRYAMLDELESRLRLRVASEGASR